MVGAGWVHPAHRVLPGEGWTGLNGAGATGSAQSSKGQHQGGTGPFMDSFHQDKLLLGFDSYSISELRA